MNIVKCDDAGLDAAAKILCAGGVAVIPTDTVYGLAAHPGFPEAVERLYAVKGRDRAKPIALLAADFAAASRFVGGIAEKPARLAAERWPGAFTLVVNGEGLRVPDHEWTRRLLAKCGGTLRVTSANPSGMEPAKDAQTAMAQIGNLVDIVVDGGPSPIGRPSEVVRVTDDGEIEIIRAG